MRSGTLDVPGATLYYEVCGAGPVLLLLPGSGGDAAVSIPSSILSHDTSPWSPSTHAATPAACSIPAHPPTSP